MKKLLYISVNSKPEELSASKTVAKELINKIKQNYPDMIIEEVDLYKDHIPRLKYQYFSKRSCIVNENEYESLDEKDKLEVDRINDLCNQFIEADVYVIASPMWSLSFPSVLKEYIDCIIQDQKTISFNDSHKGPTGLLDNKSRTMIYVQSSGAKLSWYLNPIMNKGLNYVEHIMKFIGISEFRELLVDNTGYTDEEKQNAINESLNKIDHIIKGI